MGELPENLTINEGLPDDDMEGDDLAVGSGDDDDEDAKEDDVDIDDL